MISTTPSGSGFPSCTNCADAWGGQQTELLFSSFWARTARKRARLAVLKNNTDGFKIAEYDLEMRGSGDFLGTRQSGKFINEIRNLRYPPSVIFTAKKLSDEAFEAGGVEALAALALKKYSGLKDVVLN
ncbi:MAG: hypothetical protein ACLRTQ_04955 [Candidatus Borkfalkia sp.]